MMQLGPDCRLYISPSAGALTMHVIHKPNEKGVACDLETFIPTPTRFDFYFPNLPMYRTNGNCDETIAWGITTSTNDLPLIEEIPIRVAPNPAKDYLIARFPQQRDFTKLQLQDSYGRIVEEIEVAHQLSEIEIPTVNLANGMYFLVPEKSSYTAIKFMVLH